MATAPRYEIENHITSIRDHDHDASFNVRRNGKVFYIYVKPSGFVNSPIMTKKYLAYLEVLRSGEEVVGDIYDTDVYEWLMTPFEPLFVELAPDPTGDLRNIKVTLKDHLFPEYFVFTLDIIDEKMYPRRIHRQTPPYQPSFVRFDDDFLDELEEWTAFYDPVGITLSFKNPEDALFKQPKKALIENDKIECFFKPCYSTVQSIRELKAYKMIAAAGLDRQLNLCHLYGVVMDDQGFILGLLLTFIDCDVVPLSCMVHPDDPDDPPPASRQKWMGQLDTTFDMLHEFGIVWGDVKAENVLIDQRNNAWITDFGGGYTEGWVDRDMAETQAGDLMGMLKLRKLIVPEG
ncbi:hypothetical protein HIM_08894 [Hirsutella minnesotensis 3608]|uniref:Protein kinase domain-containing protein n=1 Tax=Hirsutella minnesotensis 3608 TaxID=1043627 RepID=A0A0F7ZY18_9HYPO|nr:hypothetical protein HIM_08894 [Hirsutella minnesotensis 3608]